VLGAYELVFDAVYTPRNTRLLQEAAQAGAIVVSGMEMFIRQALHQFKLFTSGLGILFPDTHTSIDFFLPPGYPDFSTLS